MKIALIQQSASWDLEDNLRRGVSAFHEAARQGAQLIAYAELAFLPFLPQVLSTEQADFRSFAQTVPGPLTEEFAGLAKRYGAVAVLNLFEKDGGKTFDSSPLIDADGKLLGTTRMVHIMDGPGFHEQGYYAPGSNPRLVYDTKIGKIGVAICYDRHFPEYMRELAIQGAEIVVVPQAGIPDEWGEGLYEGEIRIASLQNGYFGALVNRVGKEEILHFSGESFVTDPSGQVVARAPRDQEHILFADCDLEAVSRSHARRHFLPDRRPDIYSRFGLGTDKKKA
jgi:N-carbamoylputrescine amidase